MHWSDGSSGKEIHYKVRKERYAKIYLLVGDNNWFDKINWDPIGRIHCQRYLVLSRRGRQRGNRLRGKKGRGAGKAGSQRK
jgi:hypothetical protein